MIWYTIETHKLASQSQDENLRPIILRGGFIHDWSDLQYDFEGNILKSGKLLEFVISKNIATEISGFVVKDKKQYPLLFGNDISKLDEGKFFFSERWGWMKSDSQIYAFPSNVGKPTSKDNQIVINYKDIEGNSYFTVENEKFSQVSFKGSKYD